MSYRSEIEANTAAMKKRKSSAFLAVKITSVLLVLSIAATTALVVADAMQGNLGADRTEQGGGDSASLIKPTKGKTVTVFAGDTVAYRSLVEYPAGYDLEFDTKADLSTPGKYTVTYKLTKDGKTVDTYKLTLIVEERNVEKEELMRLIGAKASTLGITKEMSKTEIVRKVYAFVHGGIPYETTSRSHTGNDRSLWQEKWIEEAKMTLQTMKGDCYSNYSLSKAFFEYFEIENVGIMRDEDDGGLDGTHFWNVVNVGTKEAPKWYYYDATQLNSRGYFSDNTRNACLITLDKLWSYQSPYVSAGTASSTFYAFDPSKYPTVETTPLS